jgi:(R,R)-butanediol dehydrogenase/meso-butanediol dehydrogenase/diacetyl reductase
MGINPGGFCQYLRVRPSALFRVPDGMDMKAAALAEPLAVAVRAVDLSGIPAGASAVVMGAGPVGLLTVCALKAAGAGQICVTELDPWRAQRARRAGADVVLDPRVQNPVQEMQQRTGSVPRHVFDCAGTANSMEEAAGIVGRHGHVVVVGIHFDGCVNLVPMTWFLKETAVHFSLGYNLREFSDSLALLAKGAVDPEVLISEVLPLGQIGKALEMLLSPGHERILVDCRDA